MVAKIQHGCLQEKQKETMHDLLIKIYRKKPFACFFKLSGCSQLISKDFEKRFEALS